MTGTIPVLGSDPTRTPDRRVPQRDPSRRLPGFEMAIWPLGLILALFIVVPMVALVWRTLQYGTDVTADTLATFRQALTLSLVTTAIAMLVIVGLGTPLAYILARRPFRGRWLVDTLVDLPIVLPPAVAGIALLMAFGRRGVLGGTLAEWGITIPFTAVAVVIAQIFVAAPFYIRAARGGFGRIEPDLEAAAADLGARPGTVFRTITLPLARPGLAAGAVLAWARALGEFGATIMFAGNLAGTTQTMPLAIYGEYGSGDLPAALLLAIILLLVSVVILLVSRLVSRDRSY
ncbi:MAG: Molybdenum ABC transporter permease protein ModB [uncultured Thermomicrobiales bacterium]|uniref:Molybdenum transport system permease n=1 Tax=uncultured Thermomicrobiales bacterium TaxID=1645740 RepID=A0A6J4VBL4_9BACT|nr:MAG: Molybdenum ABC transporter permease protein ModB [uncultured Thermomicrobiales bacterium]